jgi:hypothetical protein
MQAPTRWGLLFKRITEYTKFDIKDHIKIYTHEKFKKGKFSDNHCNE